MQRSLISGSLAFLISSVLFTVLWLGSGLSVDCLHSYLVGSGVTAIIGIGLHKELSL